jgi:hypothetical protein
MNLIAKLICIGVIGLFASTVTFAYNPNFNKTTVPYDISVMNPNVEIKAEYLGELTGYPQMYEFAIGTDKNLVLKLKQLDNNTPIPFSLIVVRENNNKGGVSEVGRIKAVDAEWAKINDSVLGLTFLQGKEFNTNIGTGVYRVEVSTPDNFGKYLLEVGTEADDFGYFSTLGDIREIQKFFNKSIFSLIESSYYHYPLGIVLIAILFYLTRRYKTEIQNRFSR